VRQIICHHEREFGRAFPLPFFAELRFFDALCGRDDALRAAHDGDVGVHFAERAFDVRPEFLERRALEHEHVQRVAHFAIQAEADGVVDALGGRALFYPHPRAAGTVERCGNAVLFGDRAEERHRASRTACHGEPHGAFRKERVRCAVLFAVHEPEGAFGQPSREERGAERVLFDRGGGAERVPADAKYRSISVFDDARGVCEHVRSALEHEGHDAERRAPPFDHVPRALAFLDDFTDARRRVRPTAQAVDHVFSHARRELQAPDGAAASARVGDVRCVGARDFGEHARIFQARREFLEEAADRGVAHFRERAERGRCAQHGALDGVGGGLRNDDELPELRERDDAIPRL
jgi:hypothetical protein